MSCYLTIDTIDPGCFAPGPNLYQCRDTGSETSDCCHRRSAKEVRAVRRDESQVPTRATPTHTSGGGALCQLGLWGVEHLRTENIKAASLAHVVDDLDESVHRLCERVRVPMVEIREDLVMPIRECCKK